MGTQQVLLIVLAVIIVGVAVAVGITMFSTQSSSANREAIKSDLMAFGSQAIAFWKAPAGMAGGGKGSPGFGANRAEALRTVGRWIGFDANGVFTNDNGRYRIWDGYGTATLLRIGCVGTQQGQNPTYNNAWGFGTGRVEVHIFISPANDNPFTWDIRN